MPSIDHFTARRLLLAVALLAGVCAAQSPLTPLTPWVPVAETNTPGPDYSQPQYWMLKPENADAKPVDVLFFHTTTYKDPNFVDPATGALLAAPRDASLPLVWNQGIDAAIEETAATAIAHSQVSVFAASCNIYAPYYRQAALPEALMGDTPAAERALSVAYLDIEAAFDHYLAHLNAGRPFILAGHSQGANLVLWLLQRRLRDPALRKQMVAAYVIGWAVTRDELDRYPHLAMCEAASQTGCIVSFNTQGPAATRSMARPGAVSVNPLLAQAATSTATAPESAHLGALLLPPAVGTPTETPQFSGAYNQDGALILTRPPDTAPLANAAQIYHSFDYAIFYRNLEQNAKDRIAAFLSR
jgi:pimeloyl-ACP methyl ester carboxylesterase